MGAFLASLSPFSWRAAGCAGRWKREACGEQGTELSEPFPGAPGESRSLGFSP